MKNRVMDGKHSKKIYENEIVDLCDEPDLQYYKGGKSFRARKRIKYFIAESNSDSDESEVKKPKKKKERKIGNGNTRAETLQYRLEMCESWNSRREPKSFAKLSNEGSSTRQNGDYEKPLQFSVSENNQSNNCCESKNTGIGKNEADAISTSCTDSTVRSDDWSINEGKPVGLVLKFDPVTSLPFVTVDPELANSLKSYQVDGLKFMWNACFESAKDFYRLRNIGGCILGQCAGTGKTLQAITFLHTALTAHRTRVKTALVICPRVVLWKWGEELKRWLRKVTTKLKIHYLHESENNIISALEVWHSDGGLALISYEQFNSLISASHHQSGYPKIQMTLANPGPDVVVCDDCYAFRNQTFHQDWSVNKLGTKIKIILTNMLLRHYLPQYLGMIQFLQHKLLGSDNLQLNLLFKKYIDAVRSPQRQPEALNVSMSKTFSKVKKLMKKHVHIWDEKMMKPYLPQKYEFVILVNLTEMQSIIYEHYAENVAKVEIDAATTDVQYQRHQLQKHTENLAKICCHPCVLATDSCTFKCVLQCCVTPGVKRRYCTYSKIPVREGSTSLQCQQDRSVASSGLGNPYPMDNETHIESSRTEIHDACYKFIHCRHESEVVDFSIKLVVLFKILKICKGIQAKVVVICHHRYSLQMVEEFLGKLDRKQKEQECLYPKLTTLRWRKDIEYIRVDERHQCLQDSEIKRAELFLLFSKADVQHQQINVDLTFANRVVLFDVTCNEELDWRGILRVWRLGQKNSCYIYRLITNGTVEEKVFRSAYRASQSGIQIKETRIDRLVDQADWYDLSPEKRGLTEEFPSDTVLADLLKEKGVTVECVWQHDPVECNNNGHQVEGKEDDSNGGVVPENENLGSQDNQGLQSGHVLKVDAKEQMETSYITNMIKRLVESTSYSVTGSPSIASTDEPLGDEKRLILEVESAPNLAVPIMIIESQLARQLRPHQLEGVNFMWNTCFKSYKTLKYPRSAENGCILGHCTSSGKILQAITFLHSALTAEQTGVKTALILCPQTRISKWKQELKKWLGKVKPRVNIHKLGSFKNNPGIFEAWHRQGGLGLISIEAFSELVKEDAPSSLVQIQSALTNPGPDILVCHDCYAFRNHEFKEHWTVNKVQTKLRVLLTSLTIKDHLLQYHCMIQFVNPSLDELKPRQHFVTNFVKPIQAGQQDNSTLEEIKVMTEKFRLLFEILKNIVHFHLSDQTV